MTKQSWKSITSYRKQAAQILLNRGEIKPLPSQSGLIMYNAVDHSKIVKLANELKQQNEAAK